MTDEEHYARRSCQGESRQRQCDYCTGCVLNKVYTTDIIILAVITKLHVNDKQKSLRILLHRTRVPMQ